MQELINTREQELSLLLDRHLAITANAGSGKTRTLVNRYLAIIDMGVSTDEVVAITFTRKAANEMLAKIIHAIENKIRKIDDDPAEMRRLMKIREKLSSARIMTIHSFCSSLLREYPAKANVNPFFVELNQAELYRIKQDNIVYVLEEMLKDERYKENVKYLLLRLGINRVVRFIDEILNRAEIFEDLKDFYFNQEPEEYLERVNIIFFKMIYEPLTQAIERLNEIIVYIEKINLTRNELLAYNDFSNVLSNINALISKILEIQGSKELWHLMERLLKIKPSIITNDFKINQKLLNKMNFQVLLSKISLEYVKESEKLFSIFRYVRDLIPAIGKDKYELELFKFNQLLFQISEKIIEEIENEKQTIGGIDYNDMLIKADKLLSDQDVADQVRKKVKYLLIDEFQDTNDLQFRIIQKLVPSLNGKIYQKEPVNLYVVGDAKQSIYAFRNADVRVFKEVIRKITGINNLRLKVDAISKRVDIHSKTYELSDIEAEGKIILSASFRLFPAIAAFVNKVCGYAFGMDNTEFDVEYEDLVCTKCVEIINNPNANIRNIGTISLLLVEKSKSQKIENETNETGNFDEALDNQEAHLLARYLLKIVEGKELFTIDDNGIRRRVKWGDICVLARTKAFCNELAEYFLSYNIPYLIHSGSGFFESVEIRDLIGFLKFLDNPYNDEAFLGILKSYFFRFDDDFLLKLKLSSEKMTFWEKFIELPTTETFNELSIAKQKKIKYSISLLQKAINSSNRISISQLIMVFLEDTHWYGIARVNPRFRQMVSNVNKFIEITRNFESRGFRNLSDFVNELKSIESSNLLEAEAPFISDEDAVNIMTIHSAKGLEFPVVAIYKSSEFKDKSPELFLSKENGVSYKLPVYEDNIYKEINTLSYTFDKIRYKEATKAEEKRLLYVALTRAKEHLIITSSNINDPSYFWKYIYESIINEFIINIVKKINQELLIDSELTFYVDGKNVKSKIKYPLNLIFNLDEVELCSKLIEAKSAEKIILTGDLDACPTEEFYSATKFNFFDSNKDEFVEFYRLGLDNKLDLRMLNADENEKIEDSIIQGVGFGVVIHKLFEKINFWLENGKINKSIFDVITNKIVSEMNLILDENLMQDLTEVCQSVVNSQFLISRLEELKNANFEYELYLPLGTEILNCVVDVLIRDKTGQYEIWDWKSNKIKNFNDLERLTNVYKLQMKIYAFIVSKLFPEQKEFSTRLLFVRAAKEFSEKDHWIKTFRFTIQELESFEEELISKTNEMKTALYFLR